MGSRTLHSICLTDSSSCYPQRPSPQPTPSHRAKGLITSRVGHLCGWPRGSSSPSGASSHPRASSRLLPSGCRSLGSGRTGPSHWRSWTRAGQTHDQLASPLPRQSLSLCCPATDSGPWTLCYWEAGLRRALEVWHSQGLEREAGLEGHFQGPFSACISQGKNPADAGQLLPLDQERWEARILPSFLIPGHFRTLGLRRHLPKEGPSRQLPGMESSGKFIFMLPFCRGLRSSLSQQNKHTAEGTSTLVNQQHTHTKEKWDGSSKTPVLKKGMLGTERSSLPS